MSYTFSATGLPPGLSLVGSQILGTPATPGNYTVTLTVSDGVSSVSETVSITIEPAAVPIPFWNLILSADCGSYSLDLAEAQLEAFAEAGSYWRESVSTAPLIVAESGSYSLDLAVAPIDGSATDGSYSLDLAVAAISESGSYSLDSVELIAIAESGSYSLDSVEVTTSLQAETTSWISRVQTLGGEPTTAATAAINAFFVAVKSQSYYSRLKLAHLFAGTTTINSAMAPLIHPSNTPASQSGFSTSNYTGSGSGAGIQGNSSGYVNHNFSLYGNMPGSSAAIGTYSKTDGGFGSVYDVGLLISSSAALVISMKWSDGNFYADSLDAINGRVYGTSPGGAGFGILSRTSATDARYYLNGTQSGLTTTTTASMPLSLTSFYSFAGGAGVGATPRKLVFTFAATGLTPTEVSHFSSAVATLIGAI